MRFLKLTIYSNSIEEQLRFYRDKLEFPVQNITEESFELIVGYSVLKFQYKENSTPYHIAFHAPDEQEEEVLLWIENKSSALKNNTEKIIDFSNWKAKSVYFYDRDKNIMEYISRRNLSRPESAIFHPKYTLGIAEIGLVTDNVKQRFKELQKYCGLLRYDGDTERFCAIGNDEGLFITINNHIKDWFPTNDKAYQSDFIAEIEEKGQQFRVKFEDNKLEISKV